jgi:shikimate dehydrogenase
MNDTIYEASQLIAGRDIFRSLAPPARLAVFGDPVAHSKSPAFQNAALRSCGIETQYVKIHARPDELSDALRALPAAGFLGANVTIPHKQAVIACCSAVSDAAEAIGAANTLVSDGAGGFRADNTDAAGFLHALESEAPLELETTRALVIGAGGAARAVVWALRSGGARVLVANRTAERAADLGEPVPFSREALDEAAGDADLVVNCTSLGMHGELPEELPLDALGPGHVVADIVYRPGGTAWLAAAEGRGARVVDGLSMLLHQGADAFRQWTGEEPPLEAMAAALGRPAARGSGAR